MNAKEQALAAKKFVAKYLGIERIEGRITEQKYDRDFWNDLLNSVLAVSDTQLECQKYVYVTVNGKRHKKKIDLYKKDTHILIEQKGSDIDLDKAEAQSDGALLTPYEQAERYYDNLNSTEKSQWIVVSNFKEIRIYDMNKRNTKDRTYDAIRLEDLPEQYDRLKFLVDANDKNTNERVKVSLKAGDIVGDMYKKLEERYKPTGEKELSAEAKQHLNKLCVRIVFCLYAQSAGLFSTKTAFHDYIKDYGAKTAATGLRELFKYLDTEKPTTLADENLKNFTYVNGGLFKEEIQIPQFDDEIFKMILDCSTNFDWSKIDPTIFGAIFESTMNEETRRNSGMHYTSIENIHKVIKPLFLDELTEELEQIKKIRTGLERKQKLLKYRDKLASLKFLDPACGSGNFLTQTYIELRRLENEAIDNYYQTAKEQKKLDLQTDQDQVPLIKVSLNQFYGIEINDFAVAVAKTALWIAESQMLAETVGVDDANKPKFFPLKDYKNIVEDNALRIDWNKVVTKEQLNYIMGNPPFVGHKNMSVEQKKDMICLFSGKQGRLDFVSAWYLKAAQYIQNTAIECAFVSTNSIVQGVHIETLWEKLFDIYSLKINFAYRTFKWTNEAAKKAAVHCVIIGFSCMERKLKKIYDATGSERIVNYISQYLTNKKTPIITSRNAPLCAVPQMIYGNIPRDGGFYTFSTDEKDSFVKKEPNAAPYFFKFLGSEEYINGKVRWILFLRDCDPSKLRAMPNVLDRVEKVKQFRLSSKAKEIQKFADTPILFAQQTQPMGKDFVIIPIVSSCRRKYIPIGYVEGNIIVNNRVFIIPEADKYTFGILNSSVHNSWMRQVGVRLKDDYSYSKDLVYNNFPWCDVTDAQKAEIERTAQGVLDARAKFPDSSLADLYDESVMPSELRKAHNENDKAVLKAYGLKADTSEEEIVAFLMKRYQELVKN